MELESEGMCLTSQQGDGLDFYNRRSASRERLLAYLGEQGDLCLLTDMKGNIGDHLIWAGTRELLNSGRVPYTAIRPEDTSIAAHPRSTLLIPGSGAFDRRWHEWLPDIVRAASSHYDKVIILPSSFDPGVPIVADCLDRPNVHAFARERRSYRLIEAFGRAALSFDCALYFPGFKDRGTTAASPIEGGPLLLALREDAGSLLPGEGLQPNRRLNRDISLSARTLDDWLAAVSQAGRVVTDRLHVAVAAVLLGRQLVYVDPYDAKISTYWDYTFEHSFDSLVTRSSLAWLVAREFAVPSHQHNRRYSGRGHPSQRSHGDFADARVDAPISGTPAATPGAAPATQTSGQDPTMRICAVACVMNSHELLRASMTHLVLNGISDFYLYDHGSDPGLASVLSEAFRTVDVRVTILRKETPHFFQKGMVGVLTELGRMDRFDVAVAFDADEFWCSTVSDRTLADQISTEMTAGLTSLRAHVLNYAQHRDVLTFTTDSLSKCLYAVPPHVDASRPCREQVDAGMPFLAMPFPSKVIARLSRHVRFLEGQHGITAPEDAGAEREAAGIIVRHLSLPARDDLALKREHGLRRIKAGFRPETGWQIQRLAFMTDEELDTYWHNNSWRLTDDRRVLVGSYEDLIEDGALAAIARDLASAIDRLGASPSAGKNAATVREIDLQTLKRLFDSLLDDYGKTDRSLSERQDELLAVRTELAATQIELRGRTAAVAALENDLADVSEARAELESALKTVERSASWRLTAPLRAIRRPLRRRG